MKKTIQRAIFASVPVLALGMMIVSTSNVSAFGGKMGDIKGPMHAGPADAQFFEKQAEILGVSVDEIKTAWAEGKTIEEFAKEKGISKAQLHARMKANRLAELKTRVAAAVTAGTMTQAEADEKIKAFQQKEAEAKADLAKALGITTAQLEAYESAGKSVDDIITELKLDKKAVFAAMRAAHLDRAIANVQALVTKGVITQDQADKRIAFIKSNMNKTFEKGMKHALGGKKRLD